MLILPHTPGSQEQGRGHRGEKGPMGLRRPAVPQGLARVGRKRAARDRGSGSWAAWPGETSAWPSVPRTGATTLSFQVRLADLPVRPRLRGPHWETPPCAGQHQLGGAEWEVCAPSGRADRARARAPQRRRYGDGTELAWGRLLNKVPPSQRPPSPHAILARTVAPTHPGHWGHVGVEVQGMGWAFSSPTFWSPSPAPVPVAHCTAATAE